MTPAASHSEPRSLRSRALEVQSQRHRGQHIVAPVNGQVASAGRRRLQGDHGNRTRRRGAAQSHTANLTEKEADHQLCAPAVGRDGKRCFCRVRTLASTDSLFSTRTSGRLCIYPEDALENPHPGITDVESPTCRATARSRFFGFGGVVGVKCVSLQGKRLASCRAIFNIGRVTAGPPDAMHHRQLYCVTRRRGTWDSRSQAAGERFDENRRRTPF